MGAAVFGSAATRRVVLALSAFAALALGGCGSNNDVSCPFYETAPPPLLSPADGSSGVSDSIRTITLGALPRGVTLTLVSSAGAVPLGSISPISGSTDVLAAIGPLTPATTYRVIANGLAAGCSPSGISATAGTFTTE
jgi:hypothetical protein